MHFLEAIQNGAGAYKGDGQHVRVFRLDGRVWDGQADLPGRAYGGSHELPVVITHLRAWSVPLDAGWEQLERKGRNP